MCDKIPFLPFLRASCRPVSWACCSTTPAWWAAALDRAQRTMELELTASAGLPGGRRQTALRQLLMAVRFLHRLRLPFMHRKPRR